MKNEDNQINEFAELEELEEQLNVKCHMDGSKMIWLLWISGLWTFNGRISIKLLVSCVTVIFAIFEIIITEN